MTIEETIDQAAKKFGVTVAQIKAGRHRNAHVICAREWVIEQHPEESDNALGKALGMKSHATVLYARRRIAARKMSIHN